ncbi:UPAR/Ly6 domain-containing protein crok isoform X2 [Lepeophtheirus salmonis]|uniref:UPAR/Ly6 domain-containing protein crok isoform X2 n=1 Tax=Lepeophtheirus salmonis TaxID=72036 RepID=UPI001AE30960|nr:uncharacterized protein LOC121126872 isoform X2 [Lepeophtheirus salmonis]
MEYTYFHCCILILFIKIEIGLGLKCHQCSSYTLKHCHDPFYHEDGKFKTNNFLNECPSDKKYNLCRKIYQIVRGDERVIRSCGYEEYKNECYKTVLEEYTTKVCTCKEDGCNIGTCIDKSILLLLCSVTTHVIFLHK